MHKQTITKITPPAQEAETVVPDDASSLTNGTDAAGTNADNHPGTSSEYTNESAEDTLNRLNRDNSTDK